MKAPATGKASLCDWAALDFGEERELGQLRRLTTQTPAFFEETVRRQVESLEKEAATLESEAAELAKEIEELTGKVAPGIG